MVADRSARRRVRARRDVIATAMAGVLVGAGLPPLTALLHQVLACDDGGGLETIGPCLARAFASLLLAFVLLSLAAAVGLRLRRVPCAGPVAVLALLTIVALVSRSYFLLGDLGQILGAAFPWIGVLVFPAVYLAWLLLLTPGADGDRRTGAVAGMVILVLVFAVPGAAKGADRRHSEAEQLRWLASVPFTVYEPATLPPDYWLYSVEGQFSSPPQVRLLYRNDERLATITQSAPYREFAPPDGCGIGYPGDGDPKNPCSPIATMPSGEPIFSWSPFTGGRLYGVRIDDTVVTADPGGGLPEEVPPEPVIISILQALRPVDSVDLGRRFFEERQKRNDAE